VQADILVQDRADSIIELAHYAVEKIEGLESFGIYLTEIGEQLINYGYKYYPLHITVMPDRRIAFTHSMFDADTENDDFSYTINIMNLDNQNISQIKRFYEPYDIQKELDSGKFSENNKQSKNYLLMFLSFMKYLPPLQSLIYDQDILFAVHNVSDASLDIRYKKNSKIEIPVDIFDSENVRYLKSAIFSVYPNVIKNGYLYTITRNEDGFIVVEKYKIDPALYGR